MFSFFCNCALENKQEKSTFYSKNTPSKDIQDHRQALVEHHNIFEPNSNTLYHGQNLRLNTEQMKQRKMKER